MHSLQLGLVHLLSLFPVNGQFAVERTEHNRLMRSCYERPRDFQCAFYALTPYPRQCEDHLFRRLSTVKLLELPPAQQPSHAANQSCRPP